MGDKKTFSIVSLGCFRNTYDSEIIVKEFLDKGYKFKENCYNCKLFIINTCGFIEQAKRESLDVIQEAIDLKRKGKIKKILVFGCFVERYRKYLEKEFKEVDEWRGILEFSKNFIERKSFSPFINFLKICEGCINNCSYCAIPLIKGPLRSKPKEEVIKEVRYLDKINIKELNIIGQDITSWGKDLINGENLTSLLKAIIREIKNIRWIRLLYTHPKHFTDELISLIANEKKICKYIDLPVQHINDRILKLMNRGITKSEIIKLIEKIRKKIPKAVLRTSIIVGFPTETEKDFKELCDFLVDTKFERLGAFIYSREENTYAYNLKGQIHRKTKERRFRELMSLQKEIIQEVNKRFLGQDLEVLVEEKKNDIYLARSEFDAYEIDGVVFLKRSHLNIGDFYKTKIVDFYDYDLVGV
ncbi:MAG: MiaB/RimO family radical SAM methylthiotransferase [Candidatus Aenigmatarchaeota archaeon]